MTNTAIIPFHDSALRCVEVDGIIYVAVKPICEHIGIDWATQLGKLVSDARFSCRAMPITAEDGKNYKTTCLPQHQLLGWLFTINSNRVKPEARDLLLAYQMETADAINDYWTKGIATRADHPQHAIPQTLPEALRFAADLADERDALVAQQLEDAPKVEAFESLINADGMCLLRDVCKIIKNNRLGQNKMYEFLRERGHIMKHSTKPYQRHVDAGLYVLKAVTFTVGGKEKFDSVTYVTPKGIEAIRQLLIEADESLGTPIFDIEWMEA